MFQCFDRSSDPPGFASARIVSVWLRGIELLDYVHLQYIANNKGGTPMSVIRQLAKNFVHLHFSSSPKSKGTSHHRLCLFLTNLPNGRKQYNNTTKLKKPLPQGTLGDDLLCMFLSALSCEFGVTCLNLSQHGPARVSDLQQHICLELVRSVSQSCMHFCSTGM